MWSAWHTSSLVIIIIAITLVGLLLPAESRFWAWMATVGLLIAFSVVMGHGITGLWYGILIDERNKVSLSRLQLMLWLFVVLSGFITAVLSNLAAEQVAPMAITVPRALWILMGISVTSLLGSALIKGSKSRHIADKEEVKYTFTLLANQGIDIGTLLTRGQIVANTDFQCARWADLFMGEETGNAGHLDLAKVQLFYFTLILILAYTLTLSSVFTSDITRIDTLPTLNTDIVILMAISHAGYLIHKALPHSQQGR